ncbi:MAG: SRPBCC family protein [Actinomycetota bacterium]|nr:SRPBCC family protein [Actinomycetota bacterium]
MGAFEESIEVEVPVRTAYNQWTQFEEYPRFMEGVEKVVQLDDTHLRWEAEVAGNRREWEAEITEQTPDQRVAWRNTAGTANAGVVTFHHLAPDRCKVMLQMEVDPQGIGEKAADAVGVIGHRIRGDLKRFKEFIEARGRETGAWRGEVEGPQNR